MKKLTAVIVLIALLLIMLQSCGINELINNLMYPGFLGIIRNTKSYSVRLYYEFDDGTPDVNSILHIDNELIHEVFLDDNGTELEEYFLDDAYKASYLYLEGENVFHKMSEECKYFLYALDISFFGLRYLDGSKFITDDELTYSPLKDELNGQCKMIFGDYEFEPFPSSK